MLAQSPDSLYLLRIPTDLSQPPVCVRTKPAVSPHHMTLSFNLLLHLILPGPGPRQDMTQATGARCFMKFARKTAFLRETLSGKEIPPFK